MGLKVFTIELTNISSDTHLRNDTKYHNFLQFNDWNLFKTSDRNIIALKYILYDDYKLFNYQDDKEYKGMPTSQAYFDEDGDIREYQLVTSENHPNRLKYKVTNDNILISSLRLAKTPALYFEKEDLSEFVFSNGFYIFTVSSNWNNKFILYILRTKKLKNILDNSIYRGIGISAYKKEDLLKLKIPLISKLHQDKIVAKIEPIEEKIRELKSKIIPPLKIINSIFAKEFEYDENLFNDFGKGMTAGTQIAQNRNLKIFETNFAELSKNDIIRFSTRFHNTPTKELMNVLDSIGTIQVKDILLEPIHRGISPKYNSDGEVPVIKTAHLKNIYIEISQEEFVDFDFYKSSERSQVRKGDILIASTGKVSLGKIDLLEEEQELVVDGHISIIRVDETKYSRQFFTYFFRSILGYFQIERDYTGTTNQIELYSNEISNFKIPNLSLSKQQEIVCKIQLELDKQEEIKLEMENERNKIDDIIEKSIL